MTPTATGVRRTVGAVLAVTAACAGLTACSSAPGGSGGSTSPGPPGLAAPLDTTLADSAGEVAVVPMGDLGQPVNTFWQVFVRPTGARAWSLVTPPGVADNGGLVVAAATTATGSVTSMLAGFEASQDLQFSPLATSTDLGRSWSPGLVTSSLAGVPDALALAPAGVLPHSSASGAGAAPATVALALVRGGGGRVLREGTNASSWSTLVDEARLASSASGRACRPTALTAVAVGPGGEPLVGAACAAPGVVGIFGDTASGWRLVGPPWSGPAATVLRLVDVGQVVETLVAFDAGAAVEVVGLARTATGAWQRSAPLTLPRGVRLLSTGTGAEGGFVVVTAAGDRLGGQTETGPAGPWRLLPTPPPGTVAIVSDGGAQVDALTVASTRFTDWALERAGATWAEQSDVYVPIEFGSSS